MKNNLPRPPLPQAAVEHIDHAHSLSVEAAGWLDEIDNLVGPADGEEVAS